MTSAAPLKVSRSVTIPNELGLHARAAAKIVSLAEQATPIVAVTSHAMVGDRERALAAGCCGYIEKPINPDTFVNEIEPYLRS